MIILGIDPGTTITGYGLIACTGKQVRLIEHGALKLGSTGSHADKLRRIFEHVQMLIDKHQPTAVAIEAPFQGKNVQSMLKLGRAQGVAMAAAMTRNLEIEEYLPKKVKMAVTGNGNASKQMVASVLAKMLHFEQGDMVLDATDGLAVAVCHFYQISGPNLPKNTTSKIPKIAKKASSWTDFLQQNPDKINKK